MDAIRHGILKSVDRTALITLNAGKIFGFLGSGRDSVDIEPDSAAPVVRFRDLSVEGWPAFEVPLPLGAEFRYAAAGPLTRVALWQVLGGHEDIIADLENRQSDLRFARLSDGVSEASLPTNVRLNLSGTGDEIVLMIRQVREPEYIGEVLRARS